jgi:methionyl-tRNA formyltransferase
MPEMIASVFMGTPRFAVPILEALAAVTDVRLVVTQPDRPAGRGRGIEAPPVKNAALALGLPVIQPDIIKGKRFAEKVASLGADVLVTAAFGRILGRSLLATPPLGCLNVHASILPKYRGAAPINRAIISGEEVTGVSIMAMDEGLDTGAVYDVAVTEIGQEETAGELTERLAAIGSRKLVEVISRLGLESPVPQNHGAASYAPILEKRDGRVNWSRSAREIHNLVRGVHPWPGATCLIEGAPLKIHMARVVDPDAEAGAPGEVIAHSSRGLEVACGRGVVGLVEIQLPGKKRLGAQAFFSGKKVPRGAILG